MAANDYSMLRDGTRPPCIHCGQTLHQINSYVSKDGWVVDYCYECAGTTGVRRHAPMVECALPPDELARFTGRDERYGRTR